MYILDEMRSVGYDDSVSRPFVLSDDQSIIKIITTTPYNTSNSGTTQCIFCLHGTQIISDRVGTPSANDRRFVFFRSDVLYEP